MRLGGLQIRTLWGVGGPFIGDDGAPHGRVTVEPDWELHVQSTNLGLWPEKKKPVRWFQHVLDNQVEVEIPNVKSIAWERSLEADAATATITLNNQWHPANLDVGPFTELGFPGYFTDDRGVSAEAQARWGHETNEWADVIIPNALLRTFEGYGGRDKTIDQAVTDGNLLCTGLWLIDEVTINPKSTLIELKCRDMAKLLIEQMLYPPLVPDAVYPLRYARFNETPASTTYRVTVPGDKTKPTVQGTPLSRTFSDASSAGTNHPGTAALDNNTTTYWLSTGHASPGDANAVEWWEMDLGSQLVDVLRVLPWDGGYQLYVSVMERGEWLGANEVPGPTEANIPYVKTVGVPSANQWLEVWLPRAFYAEKIRLSLRELQLDTATSTYKGGFREVEAYYMGTNNTVAEQAIGWQAIEAHPTGDGWWALSVEGKVFAAGDAVGYGDKFGSGEQFVDIISTPTGNGYWLLAYQGYVFAFGDAVFYGQHFVAQNFAAAMARTPSGNGYWVAYTDGQVLSFGDAIAVATAPEPILDITAMDSAMGGWILSGDGTITEFGAAADYGDNPPDPEWRAPRSLDTAPDSNGFVVLGGGGWVRGHGSVDEDAPFESPGIAAVIEAYRPQENVRPERIAVNAAGDGYWVISTDGEVYSRGAANRWGSPKSGVATLRRPGNYEDLVDIVKDLLLWSGWYLKDDIGGDPEVFGNLESTGIYAPDPLEEDFFDKKPPIDPIKQLREITGYITFVDEIGAFHYHSPNWWALGNFYEDGTPTAFLFDIDERVNMTNYSANKSDRRERSEIIITTDEPTADFENTVTTRYRPQSSWLRNMVRPAIIAVPPQVSEEEQRVMAELIALHLWFSRRLSRVTIQANPCIQIDDQVRIYERQSSETYCHYVRSVSSQHDLETGTYTMDLTTNWLGDRHNWVITAEDIPGTGGDFFEEVTLGNRTFFISDSLAEWIRKSNTRGIRTAPTPVLPLQPRDLDS